MRDFLDFIDDGEQPFWKIREYKKYLKTLRLQDAIRYEEDTVKWIVDKGANAYDREFLVKLKKVPRSYKPVIETLAGLNDPIILGKEKFALEEKAKKFMNDYLESPDERMNYLVWIKGMMSNKDLPDITLNKSKLKEGFDSLQLCIDFRDYFEYFLPNYTHDKAILFISKTLDTGLTFSTISNYLRKRKRKSGYFYS